MDDVTDPNLPDEERNGYLIGGNRNAAPVEFVASIHDETSELTFTCTVNVSRNSGEIVKVQLTDDDEQRIELPYNIFVQLTSGAAAMASVYKSDLLMQQAPPTAQFPQLGHHPGKFIGY